jgi:endonuclease/exonuclease/phosphatase family metal-dependent hydrolase
MTLLLSALALVALFLAVLWRVLTAYSPAPLEEVSVRGRTTSPAAPDELRVLSWNIGYAGLGGESDFLVDGGRHLRAPSRAIVERNLAAIAHRLVAADRDVLLLQELAPASYLTRGVDVLRGVEEALNRYQLAFAPTIRVAGLPVVGGLEVGQGTFARPHIVQARRHALQSPRLFPGVTVQHFHVLESRLRASDGSGAWVFFNVHLPAFDDGSVRRRQLADVVALLVAEHDAGSFVVAGGDWNLRLVDTAFPHTTSKRDTFWVRDLPADLTPAGWEWVVDPRTPTNRTLDQPYRQGVNYTSVIDGLLVSPNVAVLEVETLDLGFVHSDHNPVTTRLSKRSERK